MTRIAKIASLNLVWPHFKPNQNDVKNIERDSVKTIL